MFVDIISAEEALSKFREYYTSVWPALIVIHILAIIVFVCLFKRTKHSDKIISVILAFLWFWDGIVHQCILAAYLPEHWIPMTIMLVIQGMLIFYHGVLKSNLSFNYTKGTGKSVLGVFFMIYALIGYLILGFILGHPFTEGGVFFANICAFDVFTLGLLMMSGNKTPKYIVIIPLVWALLGGLLAAFVWHIWEDLGLVTAGIISSVIVFRRKRIENRVNTAVHGNKYLGACTLSARITHQKYHAEHSNQFMFKTALLSISLLTIMAGAGVAPGISKIAYAFPDVSETMIKMVLSIPPLFMIFASLI
ncbi:MAG: DUF6064 family protein, partial [Euryarchaeota archaeon]|nr:DUF6064 family protein [Euryarchaeota archaeon]